MKVKSLAVLFVFFSALILSACRLLPGKTDQPSSSFPSPTPLSASPATVTPSPQLARTVVAINTKYGPIVIKLFPDQAPQTVTNFLNKVNSGFYNGLTFHRVEPDFVVQGGDPKGDGSGGGTIKSEINNLPFKRGSIGLARGPVKEQSNDSQFFICLSDQGCQHLTSQYVNFGQVIYGMDAVDQIRVGDKINSAVTTTK